jgi:hypothetical protein
MFALKIHCLMHNYYLITILLCLLSNAISLFTEYALLALAYLDG